MPGRMELHFEVVRITKIQGMPRVELLMWNPKSNTHTTLSMDEDDAAGYGVEHGGSVSVTMDFSGRTT